MADEPLLSVKDVVAGYGAMTILNGLSFDVQAGAITTVVGPNGAGKSTAFKTIYGLLKPRAGSIRIAGRDMTGSAPAQLIEAGVSYIPQGRNIFPELSVRHNLELGAVAARGEARVRSRERLVAALDRFPALARKADRQASTLSGGEQKQLEIARGLLLEPKLILVDEPSIGLSPMMVEETFAILRAERDRGVGVLLIEQNAKAALKASDYGLVLELGRTRMHDHASALLNDPRVVDLFLGGAGAE